jgi:hypothetical protein
MVELLNLVLAFCMLVLMVIGLALRVSRWRRTSRPDK